MKNGWIRETGREGGREKEEKRENCDTEEYQQK